MLASPDATDRAVTWAALAACESRGLLGRSDGLASVAARGHEAGARSFETSYMRFGIGAAEVIALRLAGKLDEAARCAAVLAETAGHGSTPARPISTLIQGAVALERAAAYRGTTVSGGCRKPPAG